jgi:hypothetical protein
MANEAEENVVSSIATLQNRPYEKVIKYIDKHPKFAKEVDSLIDDCMDKKLTNLMKRVNDAVDSYDKEFGLGKYAKSYKKPKYTQEQAIDKVYADLEKKYPNFNDLPLDQQDTLFFNYANTSGLYKYI